MRPFIRWVCTWQATLALFSGLLMAGPAAAAVQEVTVTGIGIDKHIDKAEAIAVEFAKKRAVFLLAEKWHVPNAEERLSKLSQKVFDQSVRGATVTKRAKNGDTLYAQVVVSIQDVPLRRALGLQVSEESAPLTLRGVLAVPVFIDGEKAQVWPEHDPLYAPLKSQVRQYGREAVIVPSGDREDRARLDYDNVLKVDFDSLKVLADRYGAKEILIGIVTLGGDKTDEPTSILLHRLMPGDSRVEEVSLKATAAQDSAARLNAAAEVIARYAANISASVAEAEQAAWKKMPSHTIQINYTTIAEYGNILRVLQNTPAIAHVELPQITLQRVEGVMYVSGADEDVRKALHKAGIRLQETPDRWILSLR